MFNCLFFGDIVGEEAKDSVVDYLKDKNYDIVIANGENLSKGKGISRKIANELFNGGVNVITSGNHVWFNTDIFKDDTLNVLRPLNYYSSKNYLIPGKGALGLKTKTGVEVLVINLLGTQFMKECVESPFIVMERMSNKLPKCVIVDFHAEATAEKKAMGFYLDGKVSALIGTHTHVQTADEEVYIGGTAYITDVGMCGPVSSVIGIEREKAIEKFFTSRPVRFTVATGDIIIEAISLEIDENTGHAASIKRIREYVKKC